MDETNIARLPKWAQPVVKELTRLKLESAELVARETERLRRELKTAQAEGERQRDKLRAAMELLSCAAKGGHETAAEFVKQLLEANSVGVCSNCGV